MLDGLRLELEGRGLRFTDLLHSEELAKSILGEFRWRDTPARRGFRHRFIKLNDALCLLRAFKYVLEEWSSLRGLAESLYERGGVEGVARGVARELRREFLNWSRQRSLIPDPQGQSAMKRLLLFLRWMVRPHPDLGLWSDFMDRSELLVSLDRGVARVLNRLLGREVVKRVNWREVLEVTKLMKSLNPEDPTKYDYVLSRPTIMGYCTKKLGERICTLCPLILACKSSNLRVEVGVRKLSSSREEEILETFIARYSKVLKIDVLYTEYPLGRRKADMLFHTEDCTWWIGEVEAELNYAAIGQALLYKLLLYRLKGMWAKALVVCSKAPEDLIEASKLDPGVEVISIS